jgi:hypothetical protein
MCKAKDDLSIAASSAMDAETLTAANQAIREHIAGCQECSTPQPWVYERAEPNRLVKFLDTLYKAVRV